MYVVMKNKQVWGWYNTQAEAVAAIEEEMPKEDGVLFEMHEEGSESEELGGRSEEFHG